MPPVDEPASFEKKPGAAEGGRKTTPSRTEPPTSDLVAFTVDAATGRIVMVEGVDAAGARHQLSESERTSLVKTDANATLERVVEQAFEAGIKCVLGDQSGEKEPPESEEDAELSRVLLRSLIQRSAAQRLMQRDILSRAILGTLIEQAAGFRAAGSESAAAH